MQCSLLADAKQISRGQIHVLHNQAAATQTKPGPTTVNTHQSQTGPVPSTALSCHLVLTVRSSWHSLSSSNKLLFVVVRTGSVGERLVLLLGAFFQQAANQQVQTA